MIYYSIQALSRSNNLSNLEPTSWSIANRLTLSVVERGWFYPLYSLAETISKHSSYQYTDTTTHLTSTLSCAYSAVKFLPSLLLTQLFQITNQTMPPFPLFIQIHTCSYLTTQTKLKVSKFYGTKLGCGLEDVTVPLESIPYLIAK